MTAVHKTLPRARTPEEAGVSSEKIKDYLREAEQRGLEIHSLMVLRHGAVAAECFRAPFSPQRNHDMWSVSKSFIATALGFAVHEGLIALDTRLAELFPEYAPKKPDERWGRLTAEHLVTMTAGKSPPFLSPKGPDVNWIQTYIDAPWYNEPGAENRYINENFYMLSAALQRATGQTMMAYLTPRLFEPLGFERPAWETDNRGVECGSWGLSCRTEDLAKFILCYMNEGKFEGRQVIPAEWAKSAVRKHRDSNGMRESTQNGYGLGFWRNPERVGGWRANGMFSQFGIAFPAQDAVFVCNAAATDETAMHELVWKHIFPAFEDTAQAAQIADCLDSPFEQPPRVSPRSPLEKTIGGRCIRLRRNRLLPLMHFQVTALPVILTVKSPCLPHQVNDITLRFDEREARFRWREGGDKNELSLGLDGSYREGTMRVNGQEYIVLGAGEWLDGNSFKLKLRYIETIASQSFVLTFHGNRVVMQSESTPPVADIIEFLAGGAKTMVKNTALLKLIQWAFDFVPKLAEPKHRGRLMR